MTDSLTVFGNLSIAASNEGLFQAILEVGVNPVGFPRCWALKLILENLKKKGAICLAALLGRFAEEKTAEWAEGAYAFLGNIFAASGRVLIFARVPQTINCDHMTVKREQERNVGDLVRVCYGYLSLR